MTHTIRTYNANTGKCLYESKHTSGDKADEEYFNNIRILKSRLPKGEEVIVTRYDENGDLMVYEKVTGKN